MLSKKEFDKYIEGYEEINDALEDFAGSYVIKFASGYVKSVKIDGDKIHIETETSYCSCCSPEWDEFWLPMRYLYEDSWAEEIQAELDEEQRKLDEAKREKEAEKAKLAAEKERILYDELKAKYE